MTMSSLIVSRSSIVVYIIMISFIVPALLTLAENTTVEIILNPELPILVRYGNKSQEIATYSILKIQLPADVCLANYTSTCVELRFNNKLYVSSTSINNALFLIVSPINIFDKVIEFRKAVYVSGEGLIILIQLQDTLNVEHVAVNSVLKLSGEKISNITSLSLVRLENHTIYVSINYDRGRLPFIEFNKGDIVKILLNVDNNLLELVVLLGEFKGWSRNEYSTTQLYTRIANTTQNNMTSNTITTTAQHRESRIIRPSGPYIPEGFMNPLFIMATILLIISMVALYRANNGLNK